MRSTLHSSPAAALLAFAAAGGAAPERRWVAALLAGGVASRFAWHKSQRASRVQYQPRAIEQLTLSFGEDVLAVWLTWMATAHPLPRPSLLPH